MNVLMIDTSGKHLTVAVQKGERTYCRFDECNLQHSVRLNVFIEELLQEAQLTLAQIDVYACNVGPGSFTGIRVGVATLKAFLTVYEKKAVAVNSLEILAYNTKGRVKTAMDAGRGYWYVAEFENGQCVKEPYLSEEQPQNAVLFEEAKNNSQEFVAVVLDKVRRGAYAEKLSPLYLRKSQAEVEREQKG